jgi:hypothetical protein
VSSRTAPGSLDAVVVNLNGYGYLALASVFGSDLQVTLPPD